MVCFPNAKINIGLQIIEKRTDGFHNLQSCFYPVGWSDVLEVIPAQQFGFSSSGLAIPGNADGNLCVKAYQLLQRDFDLTPVQIHLLKIVPIGAGLGGGSADAAFALKLLNDFYALNLTSDVLENYTRQLGSDCAFFVQNKPQFCFEKGDQFADIELNLKGKFIVLVYPNLHISTAEAYAGIRPQAAQANLNEVLKMPLTAWRELVKNDFENHLFFKYPLLAHLKTQLYEQGASYASMTGSGSTIYGIFEEAPDLQNLFDAYTVWKGELF
ncbi:MAG: 4-(cytidine 5'-diphospho)-2-C-methyl-D-erythritol kinase [Cytophagia bacterium]|nr:MAG: 4-(cytidine 5'-diphospho)-2-C-methyl-D-erythritol kinase [Runella sp.]TAG19785.1 MAG: 4-(cytidine 5'-diphospho)-2-C-methyl-D-erythritol kinase [Cytophagales bacterium]TAG39420.1 MAG: 4-(cytidine 5'-diphospho)-2-C-methyl-D-erythritol kinase [Cytophagia bacterium]TAG51798.1 MAG: 4-(cytidine 5'-diphospho)-2-C-methyl-D-erythritol kinase [Runella slithyformis]TAG68216.1 MAG: 4-(cytidine 5'-diphospho)-2-C-methyl-D-erythritol kinase [Runella slithyformis]